MSEREDKRKAKGRASEKKPKAKAKESDSGKMKKVDEKKQAELAEKRKHARGYGG